MYKMPDSSLHIIDPNMPYQNSPAAPQNVMGMGPNELGPVEWSAVELRGKEMMADPEFNAWWSENYSGDIEATLTLAVNSGLMPALIRDPVSGRYADTLVKLQIEMIESPSFRAMMMNLPPMDAEKMFLEVMGGLRFFDANEASLKRAAEAMGMARKLAMP